MSHRLLSFAQNEINDEFTKEGTHLPGRSSCFIKGILLFHRGVYFSDCQPLPGAAQYSAAKDDWQSMLGAPSSIWKASERVRAIWMGSVVVWRVSIRVHSRWPFQYRCRLVGGVAVRDLAFGRAV